MFSTNVPAGNATSHTDAPFDGAWREQLTDGTPIWIRSIRADDAELEFEFLSALPPEYRGSRFLGLIREPSLEVARELTQVDPATTVALIALASTDDGPREVAAAQFLINAKGDQCDCALAVGEAWKRRGIGAVLMRHLIDAARERRVRRMRAFAPARTDHAHRSLALRLGFERREDPRDPAVVIYDLEL